MRPNHQIMRSDFERIAELKPYGIRCEYPVGDESLILFCDFDARSPYDRYQLFGRDGKRQILYIRIPKVETEQNAILRRHLAK